MVSFPLLDFLKRISDERDKFSSSKYPRLPNKRGLKERTRILPCFEERKSESYVQSDVSV